MTSATKKRSDNPQRLIDPNHPVFDSVEQALVGLSPAERANKLADLVEAASPSGLSSSASPLPPEVLQKPETKAEADEGTLRRLQALHRSKGLLGQTRDSSK